MFLPVVQRRTTFVNSFCFLKKNHFQNGITLERKNLLLMEQILFFKSCSPSRKKIKNKMSDSLDPHSVLFHLNPIALRKAKTAYNFGLSDCNRVKLLCIRVLENSFKNLAYST